MRRYSAIVRRMPCSIEYLGAMPRTSLARCPRNGMAQLVCAPRLEARRLAAVHESHLRIRQHVRTNSNASRMGRSSPTVTKLSPAPAVVLRVSTNHRETSST